MGDYSVIFWILLYVFVLGFVPSLVVFSAGFITGLGFLIRDLKYDIRKALKKKAAASEEYPQERSTP